jgi:hypothetical protein
MVYSRFTAIILFLRIRYVFSWPRLIFCWDSIIFSINTNLFPYLDMPIKGPTLSCWRSIIFPKKYVVIQLKLH